MKQPVSVIIPCFNESGNVNATYERAAKSLQGTNFELIFVDDGSTDATYSELAALKKNNPRRVKIITHENNLGIPKAWQSGLRICKFDTVCLIDGDLQNPPEAIPDLLEVLYEKQSEVVQGARSSIGRLKDQRLILSRGLNFILNITFNQRALDSKSGFIVSSKAALNDVFLDIDEFKHFQTFIGVALRARGYRVEEVETLFFSREVGNSFLTNYKVIEVLATTLRDLYVGLKVYGRKKNFTDFLFRPPTYKVSLPFYSKVRFNIYFATMPLHKWVIGKRAKTFYLWLKEMEFKKKSEIESFQLRRLKQLLQNAYSNVPYYKRAFDEAGFKPNQIRDISDISAIPLLSKKDVRENVHFAMFSKSHIKKEMLKISTSGSTGEPFTCYADKFQLEMRFATTLRALEISGWRFGDKQMRLWHQTLGMTKSQAFKERIDAWFMKRHFVPAFEMSKKSVESLIKLIEKKKPVLIDGYAESLNFIAIASSSKSKHKPKAVMSSAQQLTGSTRFQIENQFGAKVIDKYGSREFSGIAYQCLNSENYHVQDESYIVEIIVNGRPANPGEIGEIVITDLNNFSMPLIRYRIGDLAKAVKQKPCLCGRPHSQIGQISGRTQALVSCSNGVWLPGTFFAHFFKDFDFAVQHYQVVQENSSSFSIKIVPKPQFTEIVGQRIVSNLLEYTGKKQIINLELVDQIPLLMTGKRTPVVSKVELEFQNINTSNIWSR